MIEEVKRDILKILEETLSALRNGEYGSLKEISNHTLHNASIFQDKDSVSVAVIIFALYKIAGRSAGKDGAIPGKIIKAMQEAYDFLKNDRIDGYNKAVKSIFESISAVDMKLRMYIEEVIEQAQIKKGSKIYEHGISMARAAEILGISEWELMNYVGKTRIPEIEEEASDVKSRLSFTKGIFGV